MNVRTLLYAAALAVSALLPIAAQAQDDPCAGVYEYAIDAVAASAPYTVASAAIGFGERDVATISRAEWKQLADAAAASMSAVTSISPPPAVAEYHREMHDYYTLMMYIGYAGERDGVAGVLPYDGMLRTASAEWLAVDSPTSLGCLDGSEGGLS